jgi:two-component system sensor histidine kinase YesM
MNIKIPKLIVQPLVENAISHGVEINGGNGKIEINISKAENVLCITVSDNGTGIDKDKLDKVRCELESEEIHDSDKKEGMGIALKNINNRIKLEYGEAYGLQIYSKKGEGTVVSIYLPIDS